MSAATSNSVRASIQLLILYTSPLRKSAWHAASNTAAIVLGQPLSAARTNKGMLSSRDRAADAVEPDRSRYASPIALVPGDAGYNSLNKDRTGERDPGKELMAHHNLPAIIPTAGNAASVPLTSTVLRVHFFIFQVYCEYDRLGGSPAQQWLGLGSRGCRWGTRSFRR